MQDLALLLTLLFSLICFMLFGVFLLLFVRERKKVIKNNNMTKGYIVWPEKMDAYIINLKRAAERYEDCLLHASKARLGGKIQRFEAIDGEEVGPLYGLKGGETGCYLSHKSLWQKIQTLDQPVLVLEDDGILIPNAYDFLKRVHRYWDIMLLNCSEDKYLDDGDCNFSEENPDEPVVRLGKHISKMSHQAHLSCITGSICYVLTPDGARKLLSMKADAVDVLIARAVKKTMIGYCLSPPLAVHSAFHFVDSSISKINAEIAAEEKICLKAIRRAIPNVLRSDDNPIPNILHFNYGFKAKAKFEFFQFIAVASAMFHNKPDAVIFLYEYEPEGEYWDILKTLVDPIQIKAPRTIFGKNLKHHAHRSDVVRLFMLNEVGGIYLDLDTITLKDFSPLRIHDKFVMGYQGVSTHPNHGLCNATMLSPRNSQFGFHWFGNYRTFSDESWDYHSVQLPLKLAELDINLPIEILDSKHFFYPLWGQDFINLLFKYDYEDTKEAFADSYSIHLWESLTLQEMRKYFPFLLESPSFYGHFARIAMQILDKKKSRCLQTKGSTSSEFIGNMSA